MRRVTPDVQALIQATLSPKGGAEALITSWQRGETVLIACEEIVAQYEAALRQPHIQGTFAHITTEAADSAATALREQAILVPLTDVPRVVAADPPDDMVLACAVAGGAQYVVGQDPHLLRLGAYLGIPIVSLETFARIVSGEISEPLELIQPARSHPGSK